jgi:hypothetical protein
MTMDRLDEDRAAQPDSHDLWVWAVQIMAGEGVASRSLGRIDPPLHILAWGSDGPSLWCSGGAGEKANTMTRRRCAGCLTLARNMWSDLRESA